MTTVKTEESGSLGNMVIGDLTPSSIDTPDFSTREVLKKIKMEDGDLRSKYSSAWHLYLVDQLWYNHGKNSEKLKPLFKSFVVIDPEKLKFKNEEVNKELVGNYLVLPITNVSLAKFTFVGFNFKMGYSDSADTDYHTNALDLIDVCIYGKWIYAPLDKEDARNTQYWNRHSIAIQQFTDRYRSSKTKTEAVDRMRLLSEKIDQSMVEFGRMVGSIS